jgi:hypothetical protein
MSDNELDRALHEQCMQLYANNLSLNQQAHYQTKEMIDFLHLKPMGSQDVGGTY